ncbi:PAS domain S-box/diguanylate cyclase (GGDEF) domain-containing protein [Oscillatoria acuminata PCC 6304]|uniref:PAS domain S-box/diguanylate cyclase (GGDEF) domain-containing protein n=2 Tax=Oscillatoria acuminata TaxID=118323 RepID=K9TDT9_9CYAN|nr:PAS domain S-box/diguanylate cyclase (GGDEF) domain-containing protein [Oscillatoria acuminata PCC 6304]
MGRPLRVLMVEDSEDDALLLLRELKRGGYDLTVERVDNPESMKDALERENWELILADYALPQFSAPEALAVMQQMGLDLPFIIVSGQIGEEAAIAAMKAGAHDYVMKDYLARLIPAIDRELREFAGRRSRLLAEKAMQANERQLRAVFDCALDAMAIFNDLAQFTNVNPAACTLLGLSKQDLIGQPIYKYMESTCDFKTGFTKFRTVGRDTGELKISRSDGTIRDVEYSASANFISGLHLAVVHDVTDRNKDREQLLYNAFYDPLTGLPNEAWFLNGLGRSLRHSKRRPHYGFAVLFIDLDRFSIIKYSFGHLVGDLLLNATARRLGTCIRPKDTLARVGTDEFAILVDEIDDPATSLAIADRIHKELTLPFQINGHDMFSTASIGIAINFPQTAEYSQAQPPITNGNGTESSSGKSLERPEDFLRAADTAMYHAKTMGGGRTAVFERQMHSGALAMLQLETDLRLALKRQELLLYYQPIIDLKTGQIAGFEALVRWQHPRRGFVLPGEFIPVAEGTGSIVPMGAWVLEEACRQLQQWQERWQSLGLILPNRERGEGVGESAPFLTMSVNVAGVQFGNPGLVDYIDQILQQTGLSGACLKLEITETAIMAAAESAASLLKQLKKRQIQLCIDDFGTGYSSLSRLQRLPIDTLKIDRSFVSRMSSEAESLEIVRTCIDLAHNLHMDVVAEGVETLEQLAQLRALQCESGQGYLFSRPVDATTATALLMSMPQW